jgi:hypothetical protein
LHFPLKSSKQKVTHIFLGPPPFSRHKLRSTDRLEFVFAPIQSWGSWLSIHAKTSSDPDLEWWRDKVEGPKFERHHFSFPGFWREIVPSDSVPFKELNETSYLKRPLRRMGAFSWVPIVPKLSEILYFY